MAVAIVTGDRDAFQLVDDGGLVIGDGDRARDHRDDPSTTAPPCVERYGIEPELIPDFYGLKGDTSDNIPGVPGIGEKTASDLLQRFGSLEAVLEHIDEISGAKRQENLRAHREDAVVSKQLATMRRDLDRSRRRSRDVLAGEPDLAALRQTFRRYELRDPLRRLEEVLGRRSVGAARRADRRGGRGSARSRSRGSRAGPGEVAVAVVPPEIPEGALFARVGPWRFGVATGDGGPASATAPAPPRSSPRSASGRSSRTTRRRSALVPPGLAFDTMIAGYLLDPARRGYPLEELCEDRGIDPRRRGAAPPWQAVGGRDARRGAAARDRGARASARCCADVELPLVEVLASMELRRASRSTSSGSRRSPSASTPRSRSSSARSRPRPARSS